MKTITRTQLNSWLTTKEAFRAVRVAPATEPRQFSCDPAFGDFNLPLTDGGVCIAHELVTEDTSDVACLQAAIESDEFESYSDFRRDELGL